jgi:hypothetical protein
MEAEPQTFHEAWICLTPCHFALSYLVAPYLQFCTQDAEGEENRHGKKSVKEAHSYRFVPIFRTLPLP